MANFKDRSIRIENVPKAKVRFRLTRKPLFTFVCLLALGIILLITDYQVSGWVLVVIAIFGLVFVPDKVILAIYDKFFVSYPIKNNGTCTIIYWQEVSGWKYIQRKDRYDSLVIQCRDGAQYDLMVMDKYRITVYFRRYCKELEITD